ncbi:hypothetical protein H6F39_08080 [Anabaena sp. FACHB-1250]|nr:hypothetical protein [Anabaena sp. FACHB-1250]
MFSHCTTAFYITGYRDRIPTSQKRTDKSALALSPLTSLKSELTSQRLRYHTPTPQKRSLISQDDNYQITEHS